MQSICLLFAGRRGLDETSIRNSILRIPEVSRKLKETQRLLDQITDSAVHTDLFSYVQSPDDDFNSNPTLKSLVSATVQVGLFDRFVKYRSRPQFLVGRVNGCSAMKVCAEDESLFDLVRDSEFCRENSTLAHLGQQPTQLTGVKLEEYGTFQWNPAGYYETLNLESKEAASIIETLSSSYLINQCIHVGPCFEFRIPEFDKKGIQNVSSMSSIDMDPILNSFWKSA